MARATEAEILAAWTETGTVTGTMQRANAGYSAVKRTLNAAGVITPRRGPPQTARADTIPDTDERRSERDARFWQGQAKRLSAALSDAEHALEAVSGLRDQPWKPAEWLLPAKSTEPRRAALCALLSDFHVGEVVAADELLNLNSYDTDTFRARIRTYFAAACEIGPRWAADCDLQGAVVLLGGDLISGDIHDELRMTNDLTAHESARVAAEEITAGLRHFAEAFGRVHCVSVPGNHARNTQRPTAKLYARLSYDTAAAMMVADRLMDDTRITFQISPSRDAVVPILGHTVFLTHGDGMGTGGGQGFAGPILPIVRGAKKVALQQAAAQRPFDLLCHGHFHSSSNPGPVLANGSVPGYTEYGSGLRAALEPPQQWLFLMHERWGLRERAEIKLEEPKLRAKPRVRVPAVLR